MSQKIKYRQNKLDNIYLYASALPCSFFSEHVWKRIESWFQGPRYIKWQYGAGVVRFVVMLVIFPHNSAPCSFIYCPGDILLTRSLSSLASFLKLELFPTSHKSGYLQFKPIKKSILTLNKQARNVLQSTTSEQSQVCFSRLDLILTAIKAG